MHLATGAVVAARFRLVRKLGEGGMGVVWSAVDERDASPVALKFLRADALSDHEALRRFQREAKMAMRLSHDNIVRVRELVDLDGGAPAMVMDLLEGEPLAARLAREHTLSLPEFARIFLQILSAVGSAHARGVIHRDLKPDNVFLVSGGGEHDVRVLDFGIAKFRAPEGDAATTALTGTGAMLGTPYYMAPEQVFGERDIDQRADVWALGVIMYECLVGRRPFGGENFGQVFKAITRGDVVSLSVAAPRLPNDLTNVCARMLAIDREQRLSDLRVVFEVIRRYTDVEAAVFSAPTLPAGSNRDDFEEALAPTLAADTGAALARSGKASAFPPSTTSRKRAPVLAATAALVLTGAIIALLATRTSSVVPAKPTVGASVAISAEAVSATATVVTAVSSTSPSAPPPIEAPRPSNVVKPAAAPSTSTKSGVVPKTSSAPIASSSPPPAAPSPSKPVLPGGVAGGVPF